MGRETLLAHLKTGVTTLCRCWHILRADGVEIGFTDHDRRLGFEGMAFDPEAGMEAAALVQTTGLAVDNTEALGLLSSAAISEADIAAGLYDGARVRAWLVKWDEVDARMLLFQGSLGEVRRTGGAFRAELRGLTEALNTAQGFVYQRPCSAVLGDGRCTVNLDDPLLSVERSVVAAQGDLAFGFEGLDGFEEDWFARGRFRVMSGPGAGALGLIKEDRFVAGHRQMTLWQGLRRVVDVGDVVRLEAGCDRRIETCRTKFDNVLNFRGFPHIPGEDWLTSYPKRGHDNSGASRLR